MRATFGAGFSVLVFIEIFIDAAFAESVQALVDGVCVSEKPLTKRTLQPLM